MKRMRASFELERQRAAESRKAADLRTAESIESLLAEVERSTDPEILRPYMQLNLILAKLSDQHWDTVDEMNRMERDLYLATMAFGIKEATKHRLQLWVGRANIRFIQLAVAVVGAFGIGIVLVNFLAALTSDWLASTAISTVAAVASGLILGWITNRLLGRAKTRHVRRLANWYITARMRLLGARSAGRLLAWRMSRIPESWTDESGVPPDPDAHDGL